MKAGTTSVVAAVMLSTVAAGDTIHITANTNASTESPDSYGNFEGSLTYDALSGGMARLILSLTNTSSNDGWLTAIAFDGAVGTSGWTFDAAASSGLGSAWSDLPAPINSAPFGSRQYGVATGGSWESGDDPHFGLASGAHAVWVFDGFGGGDISAIDFLTPNGGHNLLMRFRGFDNGASDKLPATPVVPGPMACAALAGVGLVGRRRRR